MFEPNWTFKLGVVHKSGNGLLEPPLWGLPTPDAFAVRLNGSHVVCGPKAGTIYKNLTPLMQVYPGKLIWFRRVQMVLGTGGVRAQKRCVYYGLGIENASGRFGCRLYEDGRVEQGLECQITQ